MEEYGHGLAQSSILVLKLYHVSYPCLPNKQDCKRMALFECRIGLAHRHTHFLKYALKTSPSLKPLMETMVEMKLDVFLIVWRLCTLLSTCTCVLRYRSS